MKQYSRLMALFLVLASSFSYGSTSLIKGKNLGIYFDANSEAHAIDGSVFIKTKSVTVPSIVNCVVFMKGNASIDRSASGNTVFNAEDIIFSLTKGNTLQLENVEIAVNGCVTFQGNFDVSIGNLCNISSTEFRIVSVSDRSSSSMVESSSKNWNKVSQIESFGQSLMDLYEGIKYETVQNDEKSLVERCADEFGAEVGAIAHVVTGMEHISGANTPLDAGLRAVEIFGKNAGAIARSTGRGDEAHVLSAIGSVASIGRAIADNNCVIM